MNRYALFAALGATLLIAACGTPSKSAASADDDDKTLVTGSRIPVKNGAGAAKTSDKSLINDMNQQTRPGNDTLGGRGG